MKALHIAQEVGNTCTALLGGAAPLYNGEVGFQVHIIHSPVASHPSPWIVLVIPPDKASKIFAFFLPRCCQMHTLGVLLFSALH